MEIIRLDVGPYLKPDPVCIRIALINVIHGHDRKTFAALFQTRGESVTQVGREGGNTALPGQVITDNRDLHLFHIDFLASEVRVGVRFRQPGQQIRYRNNRNTG